jgi:acyl-CoA thioester hydrolase
MPDNPSEFVSTLKTSYRHFTTIPVRFSDQDVLGHVNNAAISTYFEQARCEQLLPRIAVSSQPNLNIVLARIVIDYRREIRYPGDVIVGVRITHIGSKSLVISGGIFVGDQCCATADATIVFFDTQTRRSALPDAAVRRALSELE